MKVGLRATHPDDQRKGVEIQAYKVPGLVPCRSVRRAPLTLKNARRIILSNVEVVMKSLSERGF